MRTIGQPYRLGIWKAKTGNIPEFIEAWQSSTDWITQHLTVNGEAVLLQDTEDPSRFVSFAFSAKPEAAEEVMARPEFLEMWERLLSHCEEVQPNRMEVAAFSVFKEE